MILIRICSIMSLHFRRIISLILTEYLSIQYNKNPHDVTAKEMIDFLKSLNEPRGKISALVRELIFIICQTLKGVDDGATNVIAMWIRRRKPLISTLYKQDYKIRDRKFERHVFPNYNIKIKDWDILEEKINPKDETIKAINAILENYGNPKNPSEHRWTYFQTNYSGYPTPKAKSLNCITNIEEPAFEPDEPPPTKNQTENEPAFEPDEPPPTKNQTENSDDFEEGSVVNVTTQGHPYYAAVVVKCYEKFVTVIFPESTDTMPYKYPKKNVKKYQTQVINGKFKPIKWKAKDLSKHQRRCIKNYEQNVENYINKLNN